MNYHRLFAASVLGLACVVVPALHAQNDQSRCIMRPKDDGTSEQVCQDDTRDAPDYSGSVHPEFGGCDDSPENSTLTLAGLAAFAFGSSAVTRQLRRRKALPL